MPRSEFLPFALPDTDDAEIAEITDTVRSGWLTTGPKTRQFEAEFAAYVGAPHAIAVNSCTAAMHLALEAIGLQAGEEVITTPLTFAATAEVVRYFNAKPVLVDVEPATLNIDPTQIAAALTPRTRALLPVHLAGLACNLEALHALAHQHQLAIIEDAAHALPTTYHGHMVGSGVSSESPTAFVASTLNNQSLITNNLSPRITCFSFYATKTLTTGEGGMICTGDETLANRCRMMSLHGISRDAWKRYTAEGSWYYEILAPGFKYNLTDVASALGLAQLRKVERMWQRRAAIAQRYTAAFAACPALQTPPAAPAGDIHAWHLYLLRLNLEQLRLDRAQFIAELKARNIGTSVHFIPLHLHPYYRTTYGYQPEHYPVAYREYQRLISLPIYSKMSDQDVNDVIAAVCEIAHQHQI